MAKMTHTQITSCLDKIAADLACGDRVMYTGVNVVYKVLVPSGETAALITVTPKKAIEVSFAKNSVYVCNGEILSQTEMERVAGFLTAQARIPAILEAMVAALKVSA